MVQCVVQDYLRVQPTPLAYADTARQEIVLTAKLLILVVVQVAHYVVNHYTTNHLRNFISTLEFWMAAVFQLSILSQVT